MNLNVAATISAGSPTSSLILEDLTATAAGISGFDGHRQVLLGRDDDRGLTAIIAIHDTTLGPAIGGTRIWMYDSFDFAMTDALRLARGMTLKAALAGLPLGGGKAVIRADPRRQKTPALLEAFAEMLMTVRGRFITSEDVGLTVADADFLRQRVDNIVGTTAGGTGNPAPVSARGVLLGMRAALAHRHGSGELDGCHVAIQGLGSVGMALAGLLHEAGASLTVADTYADRAALAAERFGATIVDDSEILSVSADIFAPCALGAVLNARTIERLRAGIVAGSANNVLARHEDGELLRSREIIYVPDFVVNAGGLIHVADEMEPGGYQRERVMRRVEAIGAVVTRILTESAQTGRATNEVALDLAKARLAAAQIRAVSAR